MHDVVSEVPGIKFRPSKSEAVVINRKRVEWSLQVGDELLFKHLQILFMSHGSWSRRLTDALGLGRY